MRVLETLPLTADDMYKLTSAQGCLVDALRAVATSALLDAPSEVRMHRSFITAPGFQCACACRSTQPAGLYHLIE